MIFERFSATAKHTSRWLRRRRTSYNAPAKSTKELTARCWRNRSQIRTRSWNVPISKPTMLMSCSCARQMPYPSVINSTACLDFSARSPRSTTSFVHLRVLALRVFLKLLASELPIRPGAIKTSWRRSKVSIRSRTYRSVYVFIMNFNGEEKKTLFWSNWWV